MLKVVEPARGFLTTPMIRRVPQAPCNYCPRYSPSHTHRTKPAEPPAKVLKRVIQAHFLNDLVQERLPQPRYAHRRYVGRARGRHGSDLAPAIYRGYRGLTKSVYLYCAKRGPKHLAACTVSHKRDPVRSSSRGCVASHARLAGSFTDWETGLHSEVHVRASHGST